MLEHIASFISSKSGVNPCRDGTDGERMQMDG